MDHATECDMRTALCEIRNALYDMGALYRGVLYVILVLCMIWVHYDNINM